MKYATLPGGEQIPAIGLGTWEMGGSTFADYSRDDQVIRVLRAALEMGYTHIDTAEMYGGGHTEELVGEAIRGFDRQKLFITSKVWSSHLHYPATLRACQASLSRLGLEYLDLYLVHWPRTSVPLGTTFRALNQLVAEGRTRWIGVSNFSLEQLERAGELAESPIANVQVPYSLFHRQVRENGVLAYCQAKGIVLTAYTPVEKGAVARDATVRAIASAHGVTPVQVALAWLTHQPQVIAIPMSMDPQHLRQNLEAASLQLSEEELRQLDSIQAGKKP